MKKLIEWVEKEPSRARRVMLFSTMFTYLFVTIACMTLVATGRSMSNFSPYYYSFSTVAAICIGFYTGTKPKIPLMPKEIKNKKDNIV